MEIWHLFLETKTTGMAQLLRYPRGKKASEEHEMAFLVAWVVYKMPSNVIFILKPLLMKNGKEPGKMYS